MGNDERLMPRDFFVIFAFSAVTWISSVFCPDLRNDRKKSCDLLKRLELTPPPCNTTKDNSSDAVGHFQERQRTVTPLNGPGAAHQIITS